MYIKHIAIKNIPIITNEERKITEIMSEFNAFGDGTGSNSILKNHSSKKKKKLNLPLTNELYMSFE